MVHTVVQIWQQYLLGVDTGTVGREFVTWFVTVAAKSSRLLVNSSLTSLSNDDGLIKIHRPEMKKI